MLTLTRFTVPPEVIAAGLARLGITPIASSALRSLPTPPAPARTLEESELETSGGVVPEFAAALEVLAAPTTILSVTSNRVGRSTFHTANFVRGSVDGPVVMQARTQDGAMDLAVVPSVTEATVLIDQLLNVTAFPGGAAGAWSLSLPGYAALLAMSDLLLEAQTQARLQRSLAGRPPAVTAPALEEQLARGIAGNDTRWAVTAGQVTMLRGLLSAQGHMAAGLEELLATGLAVRRGDGIYPSGHGDTLAAMFAQLFSCGSVALSHVVEGRQVLVAFLSLFRSVAGLTTVNVASDDDVPQVEVVRSTQTGVILTLRKLLENRAPGPELLHVPGPQAPATIPIAPSSPGPQQPGGHGPAPAGTVPPRPTTAPPRPSTPPPTPSPAGPPPPAPSAAAPPPPPPPPSAPTWVPTHTVPPGGLPAWASPDPSIPPVTTLDAQLPVRLDRIDTGWGHLTCSNGFTCWVDAARLDELPGV